MKIAAVIILYHPREELLTNIRSYYDDVEEIYIFDNSERATEFKDQLQQLTKVTYFHDGVNEGLPKRLNQGVDLLLKKEYDWILTLDQDTIFPHGTFKTYLKCFEHYQDKHRVAAFGPKFSFKDMEKDEVCKPTVVDRVITSGMLLNVNAYTKIGGFDEALFIDLVDDDFCIAAKKHGFVIVEFSNVYVTHKLGEQVYRASIKSLYLVKKKKQVHSALRCYYMYRNVHYLNEKYKGTGLELPGKLKKIVMKHIKLCLLYGRDTAKRLKFLYEARKDFKNMRMGKKEG
jgi:rhamnosyltransferase